MSTAGHAAHGHHERATEEATAGVNIFKIVAIGVVSLIIFAVSVVAAYYTLLDERNGRVAEIGEAKPNALLGKAEVGMVDFVHFDVDTRLAEFKARTKARLHSYGWVDRSKGVVHVPIDQAVRQVIEQHQGVAPQLQPLPWRTAPTAPGTLDAVMGGWRAQQAGSAQPAAPTAPAPAPAPGGAR